MLPLVCVHCALGKKETLKAASMCTAQQPQLFCGKRNCYPDLRCRAVVAHPAEGNLPFQTPHRENGPWLMMPLIS